MGKKNNKDNDIGTVLLFMQAPFLLRAEEEEVHGEKRRGTGLLSPSHVLLSRPVIKLLVSKCQFFFLLRDSENDPYPKKPLPKKKTKNKQATQKNTCHIFLPQKVPKRNTRVSEVHASTPRVHASLETGPWKPMKTLREIEANCSKSAAIFARYAERMWP